MPWQTVAEGTRILRQGGRQLNLFQILETLAKHSLRAVVIGGHAVCFHGYVRATEDVDVILLPDEWMAGEFAIRFAGIKCVRHSR